MKKFYLLLNLIFSVQILNAQTTLNVPQKLTQKGFLQLDYMSVNMVDILKQPEADMGFTGLHYNLWLHKNFYGGFGFYGSVSGKRGGLFTLGINLGAKYNLNKDFFLDAGLHLGGGGGASAPDGGGAMFLPHINLGYQFKNFSATTGWSYVNFFDGGYIKSNQLNIALQIPLTFSYTDFENSEKNYKTSTLVDTKWDSEISNISLLLHVNNLFPSGNSVFTNGTTLVNNTIRLAGFEVSSYINDNWFIFFKADGAFDGIQGGYMDIFFGGGYMFSFNKRRTNILTKFGVGAGGGGGVETAGGFLLYPDVSIEQKLFDDVYLAINKGFLLNPNSVFESSSLGFGFKYYINQSGIKKNARKFKESKIKGIEFILGQDVYFNANRYTQPTENLYQIGFQGNIYVTKNLFLAGKTSFANFGNAGAYAEGIVGLGYKSKQILNKKLNIFIQALAGAAGGGDISTGQGLIIKPSIGFDYKLSNTLGIRTDVGLVKASGGDLYSNFLNIGLSYRIGTLISKSLNSKTKNNELLQNRILLKNL